MANAERVACDRVDRRNVWRSVVGQDTLNGDAVALVKPHRAAQEANRSRGLLVGQDLRVGQACRIVDRDVHGVPTRRSASYAGAVGSSWLAAPGGASDPL